MLQFFVGGFECGFDCDGAGAAKEVAAGEALGDADAVVDVLVAGGGVLAKFCEGEVFEGFASFKAQADAFAGLFVGVAEGDTLADEVVGEVGGVAVAALGGTEAGVFANGQTCEDARDAAEHEADVLHRVKERFFVFLQVFVVREGQAFERGDEAGEAGDDAA